MSGNLRLVAFVALAAVLLAGAPAGAQCMAGPFTVDLPAGRLDERMQAVAHVSGCALDVDPGLFQGRHVAALEGSLTTQTLMLSSIRGTGLEVRLAGGRWTIDRAERTYFTQRVRDLRRHLEAERRAGRLQRPAANAYRLKLSDVSLRVSTLIREQGFLSAAERQSFVAALDDVQSGLGR